MAAIPDGETRQWWERRQDEDRKRTGRKAGENRASERARGGARVIAKTLGWAVLDKSGAVCHLSYEESAARQWTLNSDAEFRNRNMNTPGYYVVPLMEKPAKGSVVTISRSSK